MLPPLLSAGHSAVLLAALVCTLPTDLSLASWTSRTPPVSGDPFEAFRSGEVHTLSEMSDLMGPRAPPPPPPPSPSAEHPPFSHLNSLPPRPFMPRWECCHLSEDLVNWRVSCRQPAQPEHVSWLELQPGCACCNSTDSPVGDLECICHGENITVVPRTLPPGVSLITLTVTSIIEIDRDDFLPYAARLQDIVLSKNEHLRRIKADAFRNLPHLLSIYIQHAPSLRYVSRQAWHNLTSLKSLRIVGTGLEEAPDLSGLQRADYIMHMIDLDGNKIKSLPRYSIRITTDQLSLANNQLESISDLAFNGSMIGTLQLNGNLQLKYLHRLAFRGLGGLRTLDLSDTALTSLPTQGLEDIMKLLVKRTSSLRTFPSVYHFRSIQEAHLTYPYHCCAFNFPDIHDPRQHRKYQEWAEKLRRQTNCTTLSSDLSRGVAAPAGAGAPLSGGVFHSAVSEESSHLVCDADETTRLRNVRCLPAPDAFNPCEDIMGYKTLRVAVWLVVVTAVVGNVVVLVVLINRSFKLTTPKFLMCNLAFADLCMGLYLLMIASMDVHTIGVYFSYAIDWQEGIGCQVAGFLTVFASELSVFTLVTITCERWYAITNAIYLTKRLRINGAIRVMAAGWLYSALMAAFPLVGIGSYSKTSICLPVARDDQDRAGIVFLLFLLLGNCLAFLLISWFYLRMYCSISTVERGLVRPNDLKVAKRMALLVFTDFACWAPITFFGVTAIMGFPLINVTNSKILLVFFYPINSCANPYLYAIFTKQFRQEFFQMLGRRGLCRRQASRFRAAGALSRNDLLKLSNGSRSTQPRSGQTFLEMSSMRSRKLSAESVVEGRPTAGAGPERKPSGRRDCRLSPVLEASRTPEASSAAPVAHQRLPGGAAPPATVCAPLVSDAAGRDAT